MTIIETSKLLIECADFLRKQRDWTYGASDEHKADLTKWISAIESIAIPEPLNETEKD